MRPEEPITVYLKDYQPAPFSIERVALDIDLDPQATRVRARMEIERREAGGSEALQLDGIDLTLKGIALNGVPLGPESYSLTERDLTIPNLPDRFTLETDVEINPAANTSLEGLYLSGGMFCTQCEAEGFRKITYWIDRPDMLSVFSVRMNADKATCPVLLSNGNPAGQEDLGQGRHGAVWDDPHPKPSYLFALVAGDLAHIEDRYVTASGRSVDLRIYTGKGQESRCLYAMDALKRSMRWDEERFGLEYDLDVFNIVAVDDFNAGAMENKGLNIFNAALVLASPETATDTDYERIESVIAHEYFHNWTGNRITCRDWFQLCLKEGLTVYRDQEFTADMRDPTVKRIDDVTRLRAQQFPEDAGGLAHPVRPDRFIKIDNFYTATVYEKGAELVRMLDTMLGRQTFNEGLRLYLRDNDGTAATVEDFIGAFEKASGRDLDPFMTWYSQAGTPRLTASEAHDSVEQVFTLTLSQETAPTPGQPDKTPVPVPVRIGLLTSEGAPLPVALEGDNVAPEDSRVVVLNEAEQQFRFTGVAARPIPSLLRGFSAPVQIDSAMSDGDRLTLASHDPDLFVRWESVQVLAKQEITALARTGTPSPAGAELVNALGRSLEDERLSPAFLARLIVPPGEAEVARDLDAVDPAAIHEGRERYCRTMAETLREPLAKRLNAHDPEAPFSPDAAQAGQRALANTALSLLAAAGEDSALARVVTRARSATTMTDRLAALSVLADLDHAERESVLEAFHDQWQDDALVLDKWFSVQARSSRADTLDRIKALTGHKAFTLRNPNRVRALIGAFAMGNPFRFHAEDGSGYRFFAEQVLAIDALNPLFAARLLAGVKSWRRLEPTRRARIEESFRAIAETKGISDNLYEVVSKTLEG